MKNLITGTLLALGLCAAQAAPSASCLQKQSPAAAANEYAVRVTNNCGECLKVVWNVFVNGERGLLTPGDVTEQSWAAGSSKDWKWPMPKAGTYEWRATDVQSCK